ncbi:MAG: hypothetical protein JRD89_02420 [Deltaproteobacteria bacterium]|nr:hypothetical protein [Deltaproteobacteria bacterium]
MNKADRNDRIIEALKVHGTLVGAGRSVGVDRATVRRLVARSDDASAALIDGRQSLLMTRIEQHAERVRRAWWGFCRSLQKHHQMCRDMADGYADMTSDQLSEFEEKVTPVYWAVRDCRRELRARDKAHRRSIHSYVESCEGMGL